MSLQFQCVFRVLPVVLGRFTVQRFEDSISSRPIASVDRRVDLSATTPPRLYLYGVPYSPVDKFQSMVESYNRKMRMEQEKQRNMVWSDFEPRTAL